MRTTLTIAHFLLFFSVIAYAQDLDKMSVQALDSIFNELYPKGKFEEALTYAEKSLEKTQAAKIDTAIANSLNNLATVYRYMGNYEKAEENAKKALKLSDKAYPPNHANHAAFRNILAGIYKDVANFEAAEALYLEALEMRKRSIGEQHPNYATSLNNLALLYDLMERYDASEQLYLQSIEIDKKNLGEQHSDYATGLNNLATLYQKMKRYKDALPLQEKARDIYKSNLGEEHPSYAVVLNNLAGLYVDMKQFEQAEPLYLQTIAIRKKIYGELHPVYATALNNLSTLYATMLNQSASEPLKTKCVALKIQSLDIFKAVFGENHPSTTSAMNNLAGFYGSHKQPEEAIALGRQAILLNANAKEMPQNIDEQWLSVVSGFSFVSNLNALASLRFLYDIYKNIDKKQAYWICQTSLKIGERVRNEFSNERDKLRVLASMNEWVNKAITMGNELASQQAPQTRWAEAFAYTEQYKSVLLTDAIKAQRARTLSDLPDSLAQKEFDLQQQLSKLKKSIIETKDSVKMLGLQSKLNELNLEIAAFSKQLQSNYPNYFKMKYAAITATATEIQSLLPAKTAMIEYFVGDSAVYIFYLDNQQLDLTKSPITTKELTQKIADMRKTLSDYEYIKDQEQEAASLYAETAHWLYQQLLAKALANKTDINQLIIIPDGALGHLPFEVFLTEKTDKVTDYQSLAYLIKKYKISYNYSATLFKENLKSIAKNGNGQLLAYAADYTAPDSSLRHLRPLHQLKTRLTLPLLPAAQQEAELLGTSFSGNFLTGQQATEKHFKSEAAAYSVLHLAMHGLLNKRYPILSSLVFSEDKDSAEDNFLQAYEIAQLKLNAELVVLSACETGYGTFQQGEGVMSLARSFMYAGVPSLVVSLWEVNDASTTQIMQNFYNNISNGMEKAEALQAAKLQYLSNSKGLAAHPAFWSAFVQLGDNRPVVLHKKWSWWSLWWVAAGSVLGAIVWQRFRKK